MINVFSYCIVVRLLSRNMMPKKQPTRGRGRGRGRDRSASRTASTSPAASSPERASRNDAAESDTQSVTSQRDSPTQMSKKSRVLTDLGIEDEEAMVERLEEHPSCITKSWLRIKTRGRKTDCELSKLRC